MATSFRRWIHHAIALGKGERGRLAKLPETRAWTTLTPTQVFERQRATLVSLLDHAGQHVPYWRQVFQDVSFDVHTVAQASPDQVTDALQQLPVLTKRIIRAQGERMLDERIDPTTLVRRTTGGSTGEPLVFYVAPDELEHQMAINLRGFELAGVPLGTRRAKVWGYGDAMRAGNALAPVVGTTYLDAFDLTDDAFGRWTELLRRHRCTFMYGYASAIATFAEWVEREAIALPDLRVVGTTAEKLFPADRETIERALGVRVADFYGCHEVPRLASSCPDGNVHLAPDAAFIEFPQETGHDGALITSLLGHTMPLIRYDVGDSIARSAPCDCGLPFACIDIEMGKVHHLLSFDGGVRVHSTRIYQRLYDEMAFERVQIRREGPARLRVVYTAPAPAPEAAVRAHKAAIQEMVGDRVDVVIERVDDIPATGRGKRPIVVSTS